MPKIIGQAEQQHAMKEIKAGLKELESINQFLNATSCNNKFVITLVTEDKQKISAAGYTENREDVNLLIENQRKRIINHITSEAQLHRIEFDECDRLILNNEPVHIEDLSISFPEDFGLTENKTI